MFKHTTTTLAAVAATAAVLAVLAGPSAGSSSMPITTCGQVVTTNAVLTQDLTCHGVNGIIVGAHGITIDLGGHTLDGDRINDGIRDNGWDKVTIRNGAVRNFQPGVNAFNGADDLTISNVVLSGNATQGAAIEGDSASIKSASASGNGQAGFQIFGPSASVKSSTAAGNGGPGFWLDGDAGSVKSSRAVGNGSYGLLLHGETDSVASSTLSGNATGLQITGNEASVKSTTASGNEAYGVVVYGDGARLRGNRADANGFPGSASDGNGLGIRVVFTVAPTGTNSARGNDDPQNCAPTSLCPAPASKSVTKGVMPITTCGQVANTNAVVTQDLVCSGVGILANAHGITIDLNGHVLTGNYSDVGIRDLSSDDVSIKNGVLRNFSVGVAVLNNHHGVTVSNVVVAGNTDQGIYIDGASAKVVSSTAAGNGKAGIQLNRESASITSSIAAGNGLHGLWITGDGSSVKSSSAFANAQNGIYLSGHQVSLTSSDASANGATGVYVTGDLASVRSTKASGNSWYGFEVAGDAETLVRNRAEANGFPGGVSDGLGLGIENTVFTTAPEGTNLARGNDNPVECFPAPLC